ncbi:MAG: UDP-N-acetylglucosamine--N-acetylmuramyl-(pentapeptide) pyrophosphoryl-undecaprenol N-acetylglucosamine transferase [Candidatus Omnitrophica bacterium]|nr:UDP-N-acetylglucosamine--N-acetylmuramyl-(pentapeptide) pyrophosphoryl-undecaprenol N-acetylglucosamine transferase [Candidatus Omnitrophota bacterium]
MKILIGAGGSGGHVFPALETAKSLKAQEHRVIFLTTQGLAFDLIRKAGFDALIIDPPRVKLASPLSAVREALGMFNAFKDAYALIKNLSPDVVVGFGGYGAFPVVSAAIARKVPTLIHEQNVVPSRSNQVLSRFVSRIAITFDKSRQYFPPQKVVLTGCPCKNSFPQRSKAEIYRDFGFLEGVPTIFVIGGSQGSRRINEEFSKAVVMLKGDFDFQFIHICGSSDYGRLKKEYEKIKIRYQLFDFFDDVQSAYAIADLVIARSGAVTVCEILSFQKQAILIPYPLIRVHQRENAEILFEKGLAKIIDDSECFATRLKNEILEAFRAQKDNARSSCANVAAEDSPQERILQEIIRLVS